MGVEFSKELMIQEQQEHLKSYSKEQADFLAPKIFGLIELFADCLQLIGYDLINGAIHSKYNLAYVYDVIETCKVDLLFEKKRTLLLNNPNKFEENFFEFEILAFLLKSGFKAKWIKETLETKIPDIEVQIDDQKMFLELAILNASEKEKKAFNASNKISDFLFYKSNTQFSGKLIIIPGKASVEKILDKLSSKAQEANTKNDLIVYEEPGIIKIAFASTASPKAREKLTQWQKQNNVEGFTSPSGASPSPDRLKGVITRKLEERKEFTPLLICIKTSSLFPPDKQEIYEYAIGLAMALQEFDNSYGLYLSYSFSFLTSSEPKVTEHPSSEFIKNNRLIETYGFPVNGKTLLTFQNPLAKDSINRDFLKDLVDAQLAFQKPYFENYYLHLTEEQKSWKREG